jgi:hypothetical protein
VLAIRAFPRTSAPPQLTTLCNFLSHFIVGIGLHIQVGMRFAFDGKPFFFATGVNTDSNLLFIVA